MKRSSSPFTNSIPSVPALAVLCVLTGAVPSAQADTLSISISGSFLDYSYNPDGLSTVNGFPVGSGTTATLTLTFDADLAPISASGGTYNFTDSVDGGSFTLTTGAQSTTYTFQGVSFSFTEGPNDAILVGTLNGASDTGGNELYVIQLGNGSLGQDYLPFYPSNSLTTVITNGLPTLVGKSGTSFFLNKLNSQSVDFTVDSISVVSVVPEPASAVAIAGLGALAAVVPLSRLRRNRRAVRRGESSS